MWLKWSKYILVSIGLLASLIIFLFILIAFLYEDEIKKQAILELNKHIKSKVHVKNIELTAIDQFPSIALKFSNVFIEDNSEAGQIDTLLFANTLYLSFDFLDIIKSNYKIQKIIGETAYLNLKVDNSGKVNYNIWKTDTIEKDKSIHFSLDQVLVNQLRLKYTNKLNEQAYDFYTDYIKFSGDFNKAVYTLKAKSELEVLEFNAKQTCYLKNKMVDIDLRIRVNTDSSRYVINKGEMLIEGMSFNVLGNYEYKNQPFIDLNITGDEINLGSIFNVFPIKILSALKRFNAKGKVQFNSSIKGEISKEKTPIVQAGFSIESGSIIEKNSNTPLSSIYLEGLFTNQNKKQTQELKINQFSTVLGNDKLNGSISISDFKEPSIKGFIQGRIGHEQLINFFNIKAIKSDGESEIKLNYQVKYNNKNHAFDVKSIKGGVDIIELNAGSINQSNIFTEIKGNFSTNGKALISNKITGKFNNSNFQIHISLMNFLDIITSVSKTFEIEGDINIDEILMDDLLISNKKKQQQIQFKIPDFLAINLSAEIGHFRYKKFDAKKISGQFYIQENQVKAKNILFKANKGSYLFNFLLEPFKEDCFYWSVKGAANNIDITDFFKEFENFGQDYLTHSHISGKANLNFDSGFILDKSLSIDKNHITANAQIEIKKGELKEHEAMLDIASYLNNNKLVRSVINTEKLNHKIKLIKFSELKNNIVIKNKVIYIPNMGINTNVMNLDMSGEHKFNDSIDYHLNFRLREVLVKKETTEEYGPIKDDGLGKKIFLHMYGTTENPMFKLDHNEKKNERKEAVKEEKFELKSVLKEEFGLFSKDSTITGLDTKKEDSVIFEIEWDEDSDSDSVPESTHNQMNNDSLKGKKKKLNKWLEKIGVEEKKDEKVQFEIEQGI